MENFASQSPRQSGLPELRVRKSLYVEARHPHELEAGSEQCLRRAGVRRFGREFPGREHDERPDLDAPRRPEQHRDRRQGRLGGQRGGGRGDARHRHADCDAVPEPAQLDEQRRYSGSGRLRLVGGVCGDGLLMG